ncbi:MAG: nitroreductase [Syntrophales bacterium]|nr:nitroreductase [Syntrophales bacterium]MDY0045057.1 nitroreductase [Syntrophales bacterium]
MEIIKGIYSRRSVRNFTDAPVSREDLLKIMESGTWAPSGLNNQPWRFVLVQNETMRLRLSALTKYRQIIETASACIAVFLDHKVMYHETKDHQSIGACLQNMLLAAHGLELGAVWLGEILNRAEEVSSLLNVGSEMELMAVVAVGHPADRGHAPSRLPLADVLIGEF